MRPLVTPALLMEKLPITDAALALVGRRSSNPPCKGRNRGRALSARVCVDVGASIVGVRCVASTWIVHTPHSRPPTQGSP